jgi:hypothetical protein
MASNTDFLENPERFLEVILDPIDDDGDEDEDEDEDESEEEYLDRDDVRDSEESRLPVGAELLASFSDEVENWTTWELESYFYLCPIPGHVNSYALVILSWDDNWERWDWEIPHAIKNQPDAESAKRLLLNAFVEARYEAGSDSEWNQFVKSLADLR